MKSAHTGTNDRLITGWLLTHYGFSSVDQWIENTVKQLLDLTNQKLPPINLEPLFKLRNIIEYPRNYGVDRPEVRFTLAHEVGHTFWFDLSTSPPRRTLPSVPREILETLCNKIAAEILMPRWMVRKFLVEYSPTFKEDFNIQQFREIVIYFVEKFNVSPNVVARRLIEGLDLWNILVLGVTWCPKFSRKGAMRLGKLVIKESGFAIQINRIKKYETQANLDCAWRIEWYAKPLWALNEMFIPSTGTPSLHLKIAEDLYQASTHAEWLKSTEPLSAFRLGNLTKHLKRIQGTRENYPVVACFFKKPSEGKELLPIEIAKKDDDFSKRVRTKIIVCVPLTHILES